MLKEFFGICKLHVPTKATCLYYNIKSKQDFLNKINTGKPYDIIHISAHGASEGQIGISNGSTWVASPEEIEKTNHKATLVFSNACSTNRKELAEAFEGAKYFLAPQTDVDWVNAALFALMFYKRYVVDGIGMRNSFEYARERTQTKTDYPEYWL
jgi:hypothetical protein